MDRDGDRDGDVSSLTYLMICRASSNFQLHISVDGIPGPNIMAASPFLAMFAVPAGGLPLKPSPEVNSKK